MAKNPVGFQVTDATTGWSGADFDDLFIRKDCFLEGGLWVWGSNGIGELGTNNAIARSSPVQTVSGGTNWKEIHVAGNSAIGVKTDGTLWLWGSNTSGTLGDNTIITRSSPVQTISAGTNWKTAALGDLQGAGIKTDGTLWIWGSNTSGTLGDNTVINKSSPVQTILGGNNWKSVSISIRAAASIKTDGTLWLWGCNIDGLIGDNTVALRSTPVQTFSGGTNWKQVSISFASVAAIKTDGTLWTWGRNHYGQLGIDTVVSRSTPAQTVTGGTNWKSVDVAQTTMVGIKTDGTLWTWGRNHYGQLGDQTVINRSTPVQTFSGGTNWRQASSGGSKSAAIKTDGTLWVWGYNFIGQLGINSRVHRSSPVQTVTGGTGWASVQHSSIFTAAIREDCW